MKDYCPECGKDMDEVEWGQFQMCWTCAKTKMAKEGTAWIPQEAPP